MNNQISCDTFVCLPPNTLNNCVVFGKNSDRPNKEVQEIIYVPHQVHGKKTNTRCTYIEIEQTEETFATILSKPSWMWGAEMGANQFGVCIGNEAVWTKLNNAKEDLKEKLLGMDLVRLGLERSRTAGQAVTVISTLLEKHGQGGGCSDSLRNWSYHNSFLIADKREAWVLETAGTFWAAEQITTGWRNISNALSIGSKIDKMSQGLKEKATQLGFWDGMEEFHFAKVFSVHYSPEDDSRFTQGRQLLSQYSQSSRFDEKSMMKILRDEPSGICMPCDESFVSTSSQVSVLASENSGTLDCHYFTGTPDPGHSVFKPFVFLGTGCAQFLSGLVKSPLEQEDSPTFQRLPDRRHELYKEHSRCYGTLVKNRNMKEGLMKLENDCNAIVVNLLKSCKNKEKKQYCKELEDIFNTCVSKELDFYGRISCVEK